MGYCTLIIDVKTSEDMGNNMESPILIACIQKNLFQKKLKPNHILSNLVLISTEKQMISKITTFKEL